MASSHLSRLALVIFFCCCFFVIYRNEVVPLRWLLLNQKDSPEPSIIGEEYRTAYHFQPARFWINDPNGPMYYNGIYHLFYQHNPNAAFWEQGIVWAHSISTDLINWAPLEPAIKPSKPFDINGCWSGSATILPGNKPVIMYTGIDEQQRQVQNIAFPKNLSDPFLREWTKPDYNPVMSPVGDINETLFRDPTTAWQVADGHWRAAVGAEINGVGLAVLYKTKDFVKWERSEHPLSSPKSSGMWECLDFYPVPLRGKNGVDTSANSDNVKHVMKMSMYLLWFDSYILGKYDKEKDAFIEENHVNTYRKWKRYDYGNFYASKTFFDPQTRRRILWGWSNESDSKADDIAKGWAGIQAIPRTVWLDDDGKQLVQWPIKEIETLRREEVHLKDGEIKTGDLVDVKGIQASQMDVEVEFQLPKLENAEPFNAVWEFDPQVLCEQEGASVQGEIGPFGLLVMASPDLVEHTAIFFKVYKAAARHVVLMCSDQRRSSLRSGLYKPTYGGFVDIDIQKEAKISLRTLVDHSVVESFGGGGRTCITARVYPASLPNGQARIYAFNNGTKTVKISKLKAWNMAKPRVNVFDVDAE